MKLFVEENSVVRKIWGKSDTVLFIFAGASAEFALNKAVDWLYFTGKLPTDPIGRMFSTITYARRIIFSNRDDALHAIDAMKNIHAVVEKNRGASIPDWAYRDVLYMLIYYSIASYELLEKKLTDAEKEAVYNVFYKVGNKMGIKNLPSNYFEWLPERALHLTEDLKASKFTFDLFKQYKKHLGLFRYGVLIEVQKLLVPKQVKKQLYLYDFTLLVFVIPLYKFGRNFKLGLIIKDLLLPSKYKDNISQLDVVNN